MSKWKLLFIVTTVGIIGIFAASIWRITHNETHPSIAREVSFNSSFETTALLGTTSKESLPTIHNLPPQFSLTNTVKLQKFLVQFASDNSFEETPTAYYREQSIVVSEQGPTILLDIPSMKVTLEVHIASNNTLGIGCAPQADQKEASWACSDDSLGESE